MNKSNINAIALAISLAFCSGAMAQATQPPKAQNIEQPAVKPPLRSSAESPKPPMAADGSKTRKSVAAEYKSERAACRSMTGSARTTCRADAKAKMVAARASITARVEPARTGRRDQAADAAANKKRGSTEQPK